LTVGSESPLFALLRERLRVPEDLELEFKAARGGLPKSLWPTVSAFANTIGGWVILGVDERPPFEVVGIADPSSMLQSFYDQMRNPQKISQPVCGAMDASIEQTNGTSIIVIRVPATARRERPVYINGNPYHGTYVRRYAGDYHCTKPEVDRMMREASNDASDSAILQHYTLNDLESTSLASYRRRFQTLNPESPWNAYDDQRFLEAIRAYRRDRESEVEGLTVAGLLLLGTSGAIRDWRSRHLIDFRLIPGEVDPDTRWDDRVPWDGNLLGAFDTIMPRLTADLPTPFRLQGETRVDRSPVHVALREALVNLLVHADYAEAQASVIHRFPEGYSFRNPGNSRVSAMDLLSGDRSDPRNPDLVTMFRLIGLAEEAGSGMAKIIHSWRALGFQLPAIDVGTERYEFSLDLRYAHFLREDDRAWLLSLGDAWSEPEQLALVAARHSGEIDNLTLRSLTGLHAADTTRVLRGLRDRNLLQMIGVGRATRYELSPAAHSALVEVTNAAGAPALPGGHTTGSEVSDANSGVNEANSEVNGSSSQVNGSSSANVHELLLEIARPLRERPRLNPATRDNILVALCDQQPLSLRELARLTGRKDTSLRDVLRALVATGRLVFLYPAQPNHPQQKYIAASKAPQSDADDADQAP
jgi:ATP-dependent DNA helicase RecG